MGAAPSGSTATWNALRKPAHDPAPFILALALKSEHARFLQLKEGRVPKMQVQNFALTRKEVVFDVEPVHGLEMAAQHGNRNQLRDRGDFGRGIFDGM